jgi:hypothetical protein
LKIVLGAFTSRNVQTRLGNDLASGIELAARQYGRRLGSVHPPPAFTGLAARGDRPTVEIEIRLDPEDIALLEAEALRSGGDLQELLTHAVLVYSPISTAIVTTAAEEGGVGRR